MNKGLADFIKARPHYAIEAWSRKMLREGGDHPFTWCVKKASKFASDPEAFCAAVHLTAYGKTPAQRSKKE